MEKIWQAISEGRLEEAERACSTILAQEPSRLEAVFALAAIAYYRRDLALARERVTQVLTVNPNVFPALNLSARIHLETGDPATALRLAQQALRLQPNEPFVLQMIGNCQLVLGRPSEAITTFDHLIALQPDQAPGYFERANAMLQVGSSFDAMEALGKGLGFVPDLPRLEKLAELQSSLGLSDLALESAKVVLRAAPSSPSGNMIAAQSLTELGSSDAANPYWEVARTSLREPWRVDRHRAHILSTCGRFAEAEDALRSCLTEQPEQGSGYQQLFALRKATFEDQPLVERMERLWEDSSLDPVERGSLGFALGKAWDDLGDPERAMHFYDAANELRSKEMETLLPFDRSTLERECAARRQAFPKAFKDRPGPVKDRPIFVVGLMRSGTSLLEQILSSHPSVKGAGELDLWLGSERILLDFGKGRFRTQGLQDRRDAYLRLLGMLGDETRIVDKQPSNILSAGLLHEAFPDAAILNLTRRPVDVAISMWMTDGSVPYLAKRSNIVSVIRETLDQAEHWRQRIPANRFLDVPYEDLVENPEPSVRRVLEFCDLPWNDACLESQGTRTRVKTASLWQTRQPIYKTSVERWKRYDPWLGEFRELLGEKAL